MPLVQVQDLQRILELAPKQVSVSEGGVPRALEAVPESLRRLSEMDRVSEEEGEYGVSDKPGGGRNFLSSQDWTLAKGREKLIIWPHSAACRILVP